MAEANTITHMVCCACAEAKVLDLFPKLKTGKHGRNTKCKSCIAIYLKKYYADNKEKLREYASKKYLEEKEKYVVSRKAYYEKNKEEAKRRAKEWAAKNPEKRKQVAKRYVESNPEKRYETQRNERLRNPGYYAAAYKARQLRKKQAMPVWADVKSIEAMYRQSAWVSKITGIKHHVDHYYPLKSDIVCGLHVGANLRIIPAKVNLRKHNHFPDQE